MRGTDWAYDKNIENTGITPACAGNSFDKSAHFPGRKDHPRVCGEQDMLIGGLLDILGSPPRVRGTACGGSHAGD